MAVLNQKGSMLVLFICNKCVLYVAAHIMHLILTKLKMAVVCRGMFIVIQI